LFVAWSPELTAQAITQSTENLSLGRYGSLPVAGCLLPARED
jgi:hypothetical protein